MALDEGSWDPKPRVANIKGTKLKSLISTRSGAFPRTPVEAADPQEAELETPLLQVRTIHYCC